MSREVTVPRTVDHAQRRAQLADAVVAVASHAGLHAVTIRAVAAEAGVSLRFVQYYFPTKADLLTGTLDHLESLSRRRWNRRLAGLLDPPPARALIEAFCAEALPTDTASRAFQLVATSYAVLAMTDPDLAQHPFVAGIDRLEHQLTQALSRAQAHGEISGDLDVTAEAIRLVMLTHGLGTSVLIGQHSPELALTLLTDYLDRLFDTAGPNSPGPG
ncbi:TetR/AcrR family transcriptional regulator [Nocardia cyriacigeorgica]|uniref:TetR/AcrR family transcriptional regulator n=1 Tax=Nocardia cyriacigeorgica TaxID=135487 RepID=UPI00158E139C|nr:TetR family transcriptional regulator C-terminal domain-containing protein [Nocardia cyriacigeorgica]